MTLIVYITIYYYYYFGCIIHASYWLGPGIEGNSSNFQKYNVIELLIILMRRVRKARNHRGDPNCWPEVGGSKSIGIRMSNTVYFVIITTRSRSRSVKKPMRLITLQRSINFIPPEAGSDFRAEILYDVAGEYDLKTAALYSVDGGDRSKTSQVRYGRWKTECFRRGKNGLKPFSINPRPVLWWA